MLLSDLGQKRRFPGAFKLLAHRFFMRFQYDSIAAKRAVILQLKNNAFHPYRGTPPDIIENRFNQWRWRTHPRYL